MQYCIVRTQKYEILRRSRGAKSRGMKQPTPRVLSRVRAFVILGVSVAALTAVACVRAASTSTGPDPLETDADKYHLLLDNAFVRVLRYHDQPGTSTHPHHHPCFVMYALGAFDRELIFPDGSHRQRAFRAGDVIWMPAQTHTGHNTGDTPTEALLVELKAPCARHPEST